MTRFHHRGGIWSPGYRVGLGHGSLPLTRLHHTCSFKVLPSCASVAYAVTRLSVRLSVTFEYSVETNEHNLQKNFTFGQPRHSSFSSTKHYGNIPTGYPVTEALNEGGVGKNCDFLPVSGSSSRAVNATTCQVLSTRCRRTVVSCDTYRRSLLMAGDDDMFMTRSLNVTPKTAEPNLIERSDKSVAYATNKKKTALDV